MATKADREVEAWNKRHLVGGAVTVTLAAGGELKTHTASMAWLDNGTAPMVLVHGGEHGLRVALGQVKEKAKPEEAPAV